MPCTDTPLVLTGTESMGGFTHHDWHLKGESLHKHKTHQLTWRQILYCPHQLLPSLTYVTPNLLRLPPTSAVLSWCRSTESCRGRKTERKTEQEGHRGDKVRKRETRAWKRQAKLLRVVTTLSLLTGALETTPSVLQQKV